MNKRKLFTWIASGTATLLLMSSNAQSPSMPAIDLSLGPLTVTSQAVNVALSLSVEFPTAGAAYRTADYDHAQEYIGYWDPKSCYTYFDSADTSPLLGAYFRRTGAVDSDKYCNTSGAGTGYSGNLLNYAATSSIDLLRYALTGGNRVLDTANKTVLGRAFLPSQFTGTFPHPTYFPLKKLAPTLVGKVTPTFPNPSGSGNFTGIVYFTNCNDVLHVGTQSNAGTCTNANSITNNLGPAVPDTSGTPTLQYFATPPTNTATIIYTIDPLGQKQWGKSGGTTTVLPTGNDPIAGLLTPEAVDPTPRNTSILIGTGSTPQPEYPGDTPASFTYTPTSGTTTIMPTAGPVTVVGTSWVANNVSGVGYFDGVAAELNSSNWGPNGSAGTPSRTAKIRVCTVGSGSSETVVRLKSNSSNGNCSAGQRERNWDNISTYLLYTMKTLYKIYDSTPIYNYYQLVPTWYTYELLTAYQVSGVKKVLMKANVEVCDTTEGPARKGSDGVKFCKRYPNETASVGVYKPIGELQSKAEGVRVAAFGYALENGTGRYGGVLRAPMKFLGAQYRDTSGAIQSNTQAEWSATTGIFINDPLNAAAGSSAFPTGAPSFTKSGVVNYLNTFGNTGTYKGNDPVGELYYETLRYFQGLQPTSSAVSSLATAHYDNFPIYNTWTDPIQNGCQRRNFILTIGDVNTHADKQLPGHTGTAVTTADPARATVTIPGSTKQFDAVEWTNLLTGFETGTSLNYTDALGRAQNTTGNPNVVSSNTNLGTKATGSGGSSAYYWSGAAYWANTQPIRYDSITDAGKTQSLSGIRVKTFTIDVDEGGNGSIDANTRGIKPRNSSFYLAGKYGWFKDANEDGNPFKTSGGATNNKEWEDPSVPNLADGYTLASQAQRMIDGIRKFFATASSQSGAVSVSSISSQRFTTSSPNGDLYAPRFDSRDWSGTVVKSSLALNTTTNTIDALANVIWDSGQILTTGSTQSTSVVSADPYLKPSERKIYTYRREGAGGAIEFTAGNLSLFDADMRSALNTNPVSSVVDSLGTTRVNYLRGDRSQEGATTNPMRVRGSIMGDVINSGPVYKKDADPGIVDDGGYSAFAKSMSGRTAVTYVGANAGMLHAFRASDGKELFAYVPLAVAKNLNQLTSNSYSHRPFVDGVPQVSEAKIGSSWRTILASGMGGGAQGVFVLDVTNPDAFQDGAASSGKVLFEFTDQDDPAMGNVLMQPKIVKIKIPPVAPSVIPTYKWFVAVGSGYNNYVNDGAARYSLIGDQALFLLSLDKAAGDAWTEGGNYFKIVVPMSTSTLSNGMTNPGVLLGDRGEAKVMYTGDLQGNIWKFDFAEGLSNANISSNKIVKAASSVRQPLFTATNGSGARQPITVAPLITTAQQRGVMVVFGTGKFMEQADSATTGTHSLYGVWDNGGALTSDYNLTKTSLQQNAVSETSTEVVITPTAYVLGTGSGQKRGWYINMPNSRERIAVEGAIGTNSVSFASTIPSGDCTGDGDSRTYTLNAVTGASSGFIKIKSDIGFRSRPTYITVEPTAAGNYSFRRADGIRKYTVNEAVVSTGTKITDAGNVGSETTKPIPVEITSGRTSWREIRNFRN